MQGRHSTVNPVPGRDGCELWKPATAMWIGSLSAPADVSWNPAHEELQAVADGT
jgi:hypothetical protein